MPTTVTTRRRHDPWTITEDQIAERYSTVGRRVSDRFVACKAGGMLLLKLAGFIADERAEVLSVSESHVTLQLGQPWYRRWGRGADRRRPVEVHIQFAEPGEDLETWQDTNARRSVVEVFVRPLSPMIRTRDFHWRADSILRMLRLHFVAD